MGFPLYIAKRYLYAKSRQNAVNIINLITFLVLVIGSAALFIVLSGFAGLKEFSLSFSNTFDPDLKATPVYGKFFPVSEAQENALLDLADIVAFSQEIEEKVVFNHREKDHIAIIKGVDSSYNDVTGVDSTIIQGRWGINELQGVAGIDIANALSTTANDFRSPLTVIALKPGDGFLSAQSAKDSYNDFSLVLSGIYGIEENLDKKYVFADIRKVRELLEKDSTQVSALNFKLKKNADVTVMKKRLGDILGDAIVIKNRKEQNSTLHKMLNTENLATYLIFTLVLIIALFNVVGAITMMILDKQQHLKTLFSLGATLKQLRRIYFVQGILVTAVGGIIGVLLGSFLIWSQLQFGWLKITPSLAYPVAYQFINVLVVWGTIIVLGVIASKVASSRINSALIDS